MSPFYPFRFARQNRQDFDWNVDLSRGEYYFCLEKGNTGPYSFTLSMQKEISGAEISVESTTYSGEELTPNVSVTYGGVLLVAGTDYEVTYSNNIDAGSGIAKIIGMGAYTGEAEATFKISKAANALKVRAKGTPIKLWRIRAGYRTVYGRVVVSGASGEIVYKNVSKSRQHKKFKVNRSYGSVTVPSNVKMGLHKVKIKVTAKGDKNHKAGSVTVTLRIRVK